MKREIQDSNLEELTSEYRNKGRALKGYKNIKSYLLYNKDKELLHILRNHEEEPIKLDEEVEFRDNVDFLIKFYSIIEIAILSGYISPALNVKLIYEINEVLRDNAVRKYYKKNYPLLLPQALLKEVNTLKEKKIFLNDRREEIFNQFLLTIKSIENDPEVEQFQWFLDSGRTEQKNIVDFLELFEDENKIKEYAQRKAKSKVLQKAFWGYIKYVNFLTDYKVLLDDAKDEKLLQSAIWHYQSYWFIQIKSKMSNVLFTSLRKLNKIVGEVDQSKMSESAVYLRKSSSENDVFDYSEWKTESNSILNNAITDIEILIDAKLYESPLREYFKPL